MDDSKACVESGPIQEWLSFVKTEKRGNRSRQTKVKKYLSALGLKSSYIQKGKKRLNLRYKSTDGKWFYSLAKACEDEEFIQQQQRELIRALSKLSLRPSESIEFVRSVAESNQEQKKKKKRVKDCVNRSIIGPMMQEKESLRFWRKDCGPDKNYDECCVCHCSGKLLLCDGCPAAFHQTCLGLTSLPEEELWFCPHCCCDICGLMDSLENSKLMTCEQCQRRFHLNCLKEELSTVSFRYWFCSNQCSRVFSALENLIGRKIALGENDLVWTLIRAPNVEDDYDDELISKLDSAVQILHKGFMPMKDLITGEDLIEELIFKKDENSKSRGLYIALIEKYNKPITVATMRIEKDVAEIPFVATLFSYRRSGMCRMLMDEVEKQMSQMGVCRLVLPAIEDAVTTWTQGFGFLVMESSERLELVKHGMIDFVGTVMCHKFLKK